MKDFRIITILFLLLPIKLFAQSDEVFFTALAQGWKTGNTKILAPLFDDKVGITNNGKSGAFSRDEATNELLRFFNADRPLNFDLKHRGTSADGQVFIIGSLKTRAGKSYDIVCRARSLQSGYRIFKLQIEGEGR